MAKVLMVIVAGFFLTLAVITAVETVTSPKLSKVVADTRADRRKKARN